MTTFQEQVKIIKEKVGRTSLYISRIPEKSKTEFKELAREEFEGDYGFTLKHLLDFYKGIIQNPNQILSDKIDVLAEEIKSLQENSLKKEKDSGIKSVSGERIGGMKNEQTSSPSGQKSSI